jgi:hypothetical protein
VGFRLTSEMPWADGHYAFHYQIGAHAVSGLEARISCEPNSPGPTALTELKVLLRRE